MQTVYQPVFTAEQFCALYDELCNGLSGVTHFATEADCKTAYNAYTVTTGIDAHPQGQMGCRSNALCGAAIVALNPYCAYATGLSAFDAGPGQPCP
jgi:hypothetical protein